jgi:UDP-N-acetylmuramate-alanine ligase
LRGGDDDVRERGVREREVFGWCEMRWCAGLDYGNEWSANMLQPNVEGGTDFVVARGGRPMGRVCLPMPGVHNVLNALSVIATVGTMAAGGAFEAEGRGVGQLDLRQEAADESLVQPVVTAVMESLMSFQGIARRLQPVAKLPQCHIYDDYAHHPTEVGATSQPSPA